MPSGRTHDLVALALAGPTAVAVWIVTGDLTASVLAAAGELFGGLMFGPDLDIHSRQYRRWGPARFLWLPYRALVKHRSRYSHGILLGTALRVLYFLLMISLLVGLALAVRDLYIYRLPASPEQLWQGGERVLATIAGIEPVPLLALLGGLWGGAAAHTAADVVGTTLKQLWNAL